MADAALSLSSSPMEVVGGPDADFIDPEEDGGNAEAQVGDSGGGDSEPGGAGSQASVLSSTDEEAGEISGMGSDEDYAAAFRRSDESESEEAEQDGDEDQETGGRANRRIQALNARNKELVQRDQQMRSWAQNTIGQYQQLQNAYQAITQQNQQMQLGMAKMEAQLEAMAKYGPRQADSEVDPYTKFQNETLEKATERVRQDPAFQELQQRIEAQNRELESLKQAREQERKQLEIGQRRSRLNDTISTCVQSNVLDNFSESALSTKIDGRYPLKDHVEALVGAVAYAINGTPDRGAKILRSVFDAYAQGRLEAHRLGKGKSVGKSQRTKSSPSGNRAHTRASGLPSRNDVERGGHKDVLEAMMERDGLVGA